MRKLLSLSVALALVLSVLSPTAVLAAKPQPFSASGTVSYITPGTVAPAGASGNWVVSMRDVMGQFTSGPIAGLSYTLTYGGVFDSNQAGNLHGTLTAGSNKLAVNGKSNPQTFEPVAPTVVSLDPLIVLVGYLNQTVTGQWTGLEGTRGNGTFTAQVKLALGLVNGQGPHVIGIGGAVTLTGSYQP